ncbi:MAG: hypothetical protein DRO06_03955 [Thermoproteota archaeon]|nr:MAG: hypothetical protein DRO06_03955 [Candidatus Korarchaeota archaeon]
MRGKLEDLLSRARREGVSPKLCADFWIAMRMADRGERERIYAEAGNDLKKLIGEGLSYADEDLVALIDSDLTLREIVRSVVDFMEAGELEALLDRLIEAGMERSSLAGMVISRLRRSGGARAGI